MCEMCHFVVVVGDRERKRKEKVFVEEKSGGVGIVGGEMVFK